MFIYFRLSSRSVAAVLGPALPYRQSSAAPVYLRVKVSLILNIYVKGGFFPGKLVKMGSIIIRLCLTLNFFVH